MFQLCRVLATKASRPWAFTLPRFSCTHCVTVIIFKMSESVAIAVVFSRSQMSSD